MKYNILPLILLFLLHPLQGQQMKIGSGVNFLNSATVVAKIDSLVNQGAIRNNEGGLIQLSGDLVNNGVFINQDQSIVMLKGDQAQALRGNVPGTFSILTLNNSAGVNLGTDAIVYSHLVFLNGILLTDTHLLTMGDTAIITGPAATRYVDGKLAMPYNGPGAHFFPIGKGGNYRPLTLEFTALTGSSLVTAEQFEDGLNGVMPPNISQLTIGRHWTISQSGGSNMACLLTLDATDYSPAGPVVLLKQDNGTIVALATTAPDYTNTLVFNDFSDFGLGEVCINPTDGGTIASAQASCTAFNPAEITSSSLPSGHTGALVYQWQMSTTDSLNGFTDIAEANNPSYDPDTISQSTWFRRLARVVCKEDWSGTLSSNVVAITVYPEFLAGALHENQTICPNTSPVVLEASLPSGGNTPYTYQWQRWSGIGWDDIISETGLQYAPGVLGNTTKYRMVQTSGSGCGSRLTNDILVTVYREDPLPAVSIDLPFSDVCRNQGVIPLSGGSPAGGSYSGSGVFPGGLIPNTLPGGYYFNPAALSGGATALIYSYADGFGCLYSDTGLLQVNIPVQPSLTIPPLCADTGPYVLDEGQPTGGTYSGLHVTAGAFDVSMSGAGSFPVFYTVTDINGCQGWAMTQLVVHPLPLVSLTPLAGVCADQLPLSLSGALPAGGTWSGSGVNSATFDPSGPAGDHLITYTFEDIHGCRNSSDMLVSLYPLPLADAGSDTAICSGDCMQLEADGGQTYHWSFGSTQPKPVICPATSATYSVTVTNAYGCEATDGVSVTVNPLPQSVSEFFEICAGECAELSAPPGNTFLWSQGGTASVAYDCPAVTTTYSLTVTSAEGCRAFSEYQVMVKSLPQVGAGNDVSICEGSATTLTASGASNYLWNTAATTGSVLVSPVSSTVYSVTGTAANGCTASDEVSVSVLPAPLVHVTPSSPAICAGENILLTASGGVSYEWSNNAQGSQVIFSPASTTTYSLTASDALGCSAQTSVSVTVYPLPAVFAGADTSIPIGSSRTFDDAYVLGNAPFQYTWTPATDLDNPSLLQPTVAPISTMAYTLVATDARGCVNTDQVILSILTQGNTLRGQIVYDNLPQSPLQGVKVLLTCLGNKDQYTAYSGANGYFFLENLPTGTYALSGFYDQPWPWGSANASDALIVMRHFGGLESLQGLRELAGDVNASHSLNSTDALMIVRRFTGGIPDFVSGDWVLRPDTMSFGLQDIISRVYPLLSMGDVNGSYVPQLKLEPMAGLRNSGSAEVMSGAVVTLPVYVDRSVQLGAFSLEMNVPEAFELLDVGMAEGIGGQVDYTLDEGRIRLGWFHPTGVDLPQGSPLLELTLRTLDQEDPLELLPGAVIELADAEGKVIQGASLEFPSLQLLGIAGLQLGCYPNPFSSTTEVWYTLPAEGRIRLEVLNVLGELVYYTTEGIQQAGQHHIPLGKAFPAAGTYVCRLYFQNSVQSLSEALRVVRLK